MCRRVAVIAFTIASLALGTPAFAAPAVDSPNDAQISELNRHLAAMVVVPHPVRAGLAGRPAGVPAFAPSTNSSSRLLTPALLNAAAHFTKAEHLLHYQAHGLDANFWGAFNGGRGMHVRYVIHF